MAKYTPIRAENELKDNLGRFHDRAAAIKKEYYDKRAAILNDDRLSAQAQNEDAAKLLDETTEKLKAVLEEQRSYVNGLKATLEKELRGNQPMDANSILLRRDAAERARKITDEKEALAVLADAARNGDDAMAHAVGHVARQSGWVDVHEAYQEAQPESAGVATALAYVEDYTSSGAFNLANGMAYANPSA